MGMDVKWSTVINIFNGNAVTIRMIIISWQFSLLILYLLSLLQSEKIISMLSMIRVTLFRPFSRSNQFIQRF